MEKSFVPSKAMEANKLANPESGEGHNQPEETATEHVISIRGRLQESRLQERFMRLGLEASVKEEDNGHKPLIGQVPTLLSMETKLKRYIQPRFMSIGPVHHDKNELKQGQQYKSQLTEVFIRRSSQSKEILYNNILNEIESFKECYDQQELLKKFSGDDQELAWMFFVDGCALIQFVFYFVENMFYSMKIAFDQIELVASDLMIIDNQLPLGVLNLVMGFSKEGGQLYQNDPLVREQSEGFRQSICRFIEIIEMTNFERREKGVKADDTVTDQSFNKANHLLELFWMNFVKEEKDGRSYRTAATSRHFRSVKDLHTAGIRLEPNHSTSSLRDISFDRGILFWKLKIPSFVVSEQRKFLLFNLIAFEMHPNFTKDLVVTSYISFLNSLIATKEDVAELQKVGILLNHFPNDQEVVKTFRELTTSLKPYPDIFSRTKFELICYFNSKKSMTTGKWLSEVMQVYFRSPWTTIAFISATFLLILTIIQTIFSILKYQRRETICDFIPEKFNANCSKLVTSLFNASLSLRKNG